MHTLISPNNHHRLQAAQQYLTQFPPGTKVTVIASTRRAADELLHRVSQSTGGLFGVTTTSFQQLVENLAAPLLASHQKVISTSATLEALVTRVIAGAELGRFEPLRDSRRFPRALTRTLNELRLAEVNQSDLDETLQPIFSKYKEELEKAGLADQRDVLEAALAQDLPSHPILLLDLPITSPLQARLIQKLSTNAFATIPEGDTATKQFLSGPPETDPTQPQTAIEHLQYRLFQPTESVPTEQDQVRFFSAPGEGRECVEIARRILEETRRGVALDEIAVVLRSPHYSSLLETAFRRAGLPAYFLKGTQRPDPGGRAFMVLLRCAYEGLSARRFAEYLSLGQAPVTTSEGAPPEASGQWVAPEEEDTDFESQHDAEPADEGYVPAPRWWEQLLVEASVLKGADRWRTRLVGLEVEYAMRAAEPDPESPRRETYERTARQLALLRQFALPLIEELESLPQETAPWSEWVSQLSRLAERALRAPQPVLAQLFQLRSLGESLEADLPTVIRVLEGQLLNLRTDPPQRRFGRVFVGTPDCLRGRSFEVVFLPGLAEGAFPVKLVEDPILPDEQRERLSPHLPTRSHLAAEERLRLKLILGATRSRIHLSYPRLDAVQGRPRVPSFYALEILRTARGSFPKLSELEAEAIQASQSRLDWPAPPLPKDAIDPFEHDLAVLRTLLSHTEESKGKARYLLDSNPYLKRSLGRRWLRWQDKWSLYDGLLNPSEEVLQMLQEQRLGTRAYSPTALQRFARCPYHFYLAAIQGLSPREEYDTNEEITPQIKGLIIHEVQARFMLEDYSHDAQGLNRAVDDVAGEYEEVLAPPIGRIWEDEIERLRIDLQIWFQQLQEDTEQWEPSAFEWSFGLTQNPHRDPKSSDDPIAIDGRFLVRGSVDWVDTHRQNGQIRVTDHKTGNPLRGKLKAVQGGEVLQPLLYGMAAEIGLASTATSARLSYCTTRGGFKSRIVKLSSPERQALLKVLEVIDQSIEHGFFPALPGQGRCGYCDFRPVCGPMEEERSARKVDDLRLHPLREIRGMD